MCMMQCWYVENFRAFFLHFCLSTLGVGLSTGVVGIFVLIYRVVARFSTQAYSLCKVNKFLRFSAPVMWKTCAQRRNKLFTSPPCALTNCAPVDNL